MDERQILEQMLWDTLFDAQQQIIAASLHESPEKWLERLRSRVLCLMRGDGDLVKLVNDPEWPKSVLPTSNNSEGELS